MNCILSLLKDIETIYKKKKEKREHRDRKIDEI
jgi:hypothetical protein